MAVRLTVIMIENAPPTAKAGRLAEDIVGHLIGRPGIDVTLIRSLSDLQAGSTDQLTLDSITADAAVLDWQSPESIVRLLNEVGFAGVRAAHRFDSQAPAESTGGRRIYGFDLTQFSEASELTKALDILKSERQVRTFSIAALAPPSSKSTAPNPLSPPSQSPTSSATVAQNQSVKPVAKTGPDDRSGPATDRQIVSDIDLDDLIDQLDQSDT